MNQGFDLGNIHFLFSMQWFQPKACKDVRDRLFAILAFATYGSSFKVDYRLNPFDLLLESLWLERESMAQQLSLTAHLLNITPLSIMLHSDRKQQMLRDPCSGKNVEIPGDAELLHLRSASSDLDNERWLSLAAPSRKVSRTVWGTYASYEMENFTRRNGLHFPPEARKPFALSFDGLDVFLVVAVSFDRSRPTKPERASLDRNTVLVNDGLTDDEFLDQRPKGCRVLGIYSATCMPKPTL